MMPKVRRTRRHASMESRSSRHHGQERENLGEKVTGWIREHPQCQVVDTIVTQSSDEAFHCLAITVFYLEDRQAK